MKVFSSTTKKVGIILGLLTLVLLFSISNASAQTYEHPSRQTINLSNPTNVPTIESIPPQTRTSVKLHIDGIKNILFGNKYPSTQILLRPNKIQFSIRVEVLEDSAISTHSRLVAIIKDSEDLTRGFKAIALENVFQDINQYKKKNLDKTFLGPGENLVTRYTFQLPKSAKLGKWQICPILYSRENYERYNLNLNSPPTFGSFNYEDVEPISRKFNENSLEVVSGEVIWLQPLLRIFPFLGIISLFCWIMQWRRNKSYKIFAILTALFFGLPTFVVVFT